MGIGKVLTIVGVTSFGFLFGFKVLAADTATVAATVTVQNISVTVSDGTVAYGTLAVNTTKSTIAADLNDLQTATNNGNITEDFNIRGQNSTAWTLGATAAADQYIHRFCTATCGTPPTNYTALTTSYQTLGTAVATSGTKTFDLQINTPTSSSSFASQAVDVIVQAVAN
ncbi:MAG: hypothetical protein UT34_C0001G0021 [candidate division WS6 bacterium GW2011_GWF2_39_15]|uniref:Spore coat protein U domain-containing protein n=1 Tax=candidate division WS6 bacterium GW2011_GWF2_39_15 TaxID=1619100 RepID=A0A0G0MZE8_9BACT|nr:MAG: hypothetical protein UT34_C0001G0021 [candidate division WS6 bacterium GW2011_GWF2_39_15]